MSYRQQQYPNHEPYQERPHEYNITYDDQAKMRSLSPNDYQSRSQSPFSNNYNSQSPYNYQKSQMDGSPLSRDIRVSELSEKKRAQIQRERAVLEDNMKDLTYMELLYGGASKSKKHNRSKSPSQQKPRKSRWNNESVNKSDISGPKETYYYESIDPKNDDRMSMGDFKNSSPDSLKKHQQIDEYLYQEAIQRKSPSPNKQQNGLTPKASKHYEGVKNLYWQELEILKHNIQQCENQDKRLVPTYDQRERRLWQSFSRSPSPHKHTLEESPISNEDFEDDTVQVPYDPSPTKLKEVIRPENILKNEIYRMMLKEPPAQQLDSSCALTYSKNPGDFSQTSQFGPLKSSLASRKQGITPYDEYQQRISERPNEQSSRSGNQIEEDIEQLRDENDKIKYNLAMMMEQQKKGVSFSSKEMSHYYEKSSPSIATNPYKQNLFNSAQKDPSKGSNIITDDNNMSSNNAHNLTLSPGDHFHQYGNARDHQYSMLINADDNQLSQYLKQDEDIDTATREQQEREMNSPYRRLGYLDQMKKIRKEREMQEKELQMAELKREKLKQNVLRQRVKQDMGNSLKSKIPTNRSIQKKNQSTRNPNKLDINQSLNYMTPQKEASVASHRSKQSYMVVPSFVQQLHGESGAIDYKEYYRRISKYDIDRANVDFGKIHKEKMKDRTDNVKIKREEVDKGAVAKHQQEVETTEQKIQTLHLIKERQERERREFLRRQQDAFRRAIEERNTVDKNMQYLSPNVNQKGKQQKRDSNLGTPKRQNAPKMTEWAGEVAIDGPTREDLDVKDLQQKLRLNLPLKNQQ